jgi:hypothetical protein
LRRVFGFQLLLFALVLGLVQFFLRRVRPFMGRRDGIIGCVCCRSKNRAATRIADNAIIAFFIISL